MLLCKVLALHSYVPITYRICINTFFFPNLNIL